MTRAIVTFALSALLCGCLPIPHTEQVIPKLSGTVTLNGKPLKDAKIHVTYGHDHDKARVVATTDSKGFFSYPGKREVYPLMVYGDPGFDWWLTIYTYDRPYLGFADAGLGYVQESMSFKCEIGTSSLEQACVAQ